MDAATLSAFEARVRRTNGCWEWVGYVNRSGYGSMMVAGRSTYAHRIALAVDGRPVPPGMVTDHLCRNRRCVRPDHLEIVTQRINFLRGTHPTALAVRTNTCPRGHELSDAYTDPQGKRHCRTCRQATDRKRGYRYKPHPRPRTTRAEYLAHQRAWELTHVDERYARRRELYQANVEESRRKQREYRARKRAA